MRDRIVAKGILPERVVVLPPWSHDGEVNMIQWGGSDFAKRTGWTGNSW
ncbi:MAG: hypothetical protein JWR69_433 [Pedosphaera sp.]|nr:hypothetical protein [Pedosphaera sp.]